MGIRLIVVGQSWLSSRLGNALHEDASNLVLATVLRTASIIFLIADEQVFIVEPANFGTRPIAWPRVPVSMYWKQAPISSYAYIGRLAAKESCFIAVFGDMLGGSRHQDPGP